MNLEQEIVVAIRAVFGPGSHPLHEPRFNGSEKNCVCNCLNSTFVSSVGKFVDQFERELASYSGAKRTVATLNGTAALQIGLKFAGVGNSDEVLMPALTFVATANAVNDLSAVPHFGDVNQEMLGVDPEALRDWLERNSEITSGE